MFVTLTNVAAPLLTTGSVIEQISVVDKVKFNVSIYPVLQFVYCKIPGAVAVILNVSH